MRTQNSVLAFCMVMDHLVWEADCVDGTGSGSYPMLSFSISM